ncbi:MAG TPA: DoxX family membrane protein [Candidatus Binataceae bacterium]|nr:DoxX family membrane protein [Candidatus Binataceae bacterium]
MKSSLINVILRSLLGLIFVVFGLNKFFHFIPNPPLPDPATEFFGAMFKTGYFVPMLASTEVIGGAILLSGFMTPFALVLLAPVIFNIVMFNLFLAPGNLPVPIVIALLEVILAWMHRAAFALLFSDGSMPARSAIGAEAHA